MYAALIKRILKRSVSGKATVAFSEIELSVLEAKNFQLQCDLFQIVNETDLFRKEI